MVDAKTNGLAQARSGQPKPKIRLEAETAKAIAYLHERMNAATGRTLEAASFVYALIELLAETGTICIEDLDTRKKQLSGRLLKKYMRHDPGVILQEPAQDKYSWQGSVEIDCDNRLPLCKAACCKMVFPLSRQDIREGIVEWQLDKPYVIAKGEDGYCRHLQRGSCRCTIHTHRPVPCRAYDCRKDQRIWLDFENKVINPKLEHPDWPHNLSSADMEFAGAAE